MWMIQLRLKPETVEGMKRAFPNATLPPDGVFEDLSHEPPRVDANGTVSYALANPADAAEGARAPVLVRRVVSSGDMHSIAWREV